jgi:NADH-quinone oxidoreductase subunit G
LIAKQAGARLGTLAEGGNSAGAWLAGCVPHRQAGAKTAEVSGMDWRAMFEAGLKGYLLLGIEPERDCIDSAAAVKAMENAEFVVAMSAYAGEALKAQADVLLPIATFAETAGSFINAEGHWQHFRGAVAAPGEARPAWKVMRVLGNLFDLSGFEYTSAEQVRAEMEALFSDVPMGGGDEWLPEGMSSPHQGLLRIADVPIYAVDAMVRRAAPLQMTRDADVAQIRANAATLARAGLSGASEARLSQGGHEVVLPLIEDARLPDNAVSLPAGLAESVGLAGSYTPVELSAV